MKKRSRKSKTPVKKFKVPANLRDAAKAFVQLTRDQGTIELGSGVLLTLAEISLDCKCNCTVSGLFTSGPEKLAAGKTGKYTFEVGAIGTNPACTKDSCMHTDTNFGVSALGTLKKLNKSTVEVTALPNATIGGKIQLTATPVATCDCRKGEASITKKCTAMLETLLIEVIK